MPRNGNGDYELPAGNPVVPGTVIQTDWANPTMSDIASALTDSIAVDGQSTPIANLPMGGFHHTGVSDPTSRNQYATLGMSQDGRNVRIQITGGVDNLTGTLVGGATAYVAGSILSFFAPATNTGPMTLSYNGIEAKSLVTSQGLPLVAADITGGKNYLVQYNGSTFQLLSPVASQYGSIYQQSSVTGWKRPESGVYPTLTLASGTSINVPAGQGVIVPPGSDGANGAVAVAWDSQSITLVYLSTSFTTTIAVDASGGIYQFAGRIPSGEERNYIVLGVATHITGTATSVTTTPAVFGDDGYLGVDTANVLSNILISGGRVTANGANLLLNIAEGKISAPGASSTTPDTPNTITFPAAVGFSYRTLAGQSTVGAVISTAPVTNYDPNGSGTVTALPNPGDCTVHRLFYLYGDFIWVYGQIAYTGVSTALTYLEVDRTKFVRSLRLSDATLIAEIISTKSNTDLSGVNAAIISYGGGNLSIGSSGGIGDAPSDGQTYGRRNATWSTVVAAATPNFTGDVQITKSAPKVIEVFNPVGAGYAGLNVKQLGFNWANMEVTYPDDKTYFRSYDPANGTLRNTTTWDLATGTWTFPGNVIATTFNGKTLPATIGDVVGPVSSMDNQVALFDGITGKLIKAGSVVGTAAYANAQTSVTDTTAGAVLAQGAFGLGAQGVAVTDANSANRNGWFQLNTPYTNSPLANAPAVIRVSIENGRITQYADAYVSAFGSVGTYRRYYNGTTWSAWIAAVQAGDSPVFGNVSEAYLDKGNVTGTVDISPTTAGDQKFTMTGNTSVTFNTFVMTEGYSCVVNVQVVGAFAVTWPAGIFWPGGTIPTYQSTSQYTFQVRKKVGGAVEIFGFQSGKNMVAV